MITDISRLVFLSQRFSFWTNAVPIIWELNLYLYHELLELLMHSNFHRQKEKKSKIINMLKQNYC